MRYVKHKREKVGPCSVCKQIRVLTYDHIPPSSAGNSDAVLLISAMSAISGHAQEDRPLISQNGYKIRSICGECNSHVGREYDPVIGKLCSDIQSYLGASITVPAATSFETIPARLLRGVLAHLLAAKLSPDAMLIDQRIREFLADHERSLDPGLHLYYWLYPYPQITILRDFATVVETGKGREPALCSVLKFPPVAFFLTEAAYFRGLPDLAELSHFGIDAPGRIHLTFDRYPPADWPEGVEYSGFLVMGNAGTGSIQGTPRRSRLRD